MMEQLNDIATEVKGNGFRIESWEIARKDGGVFMHYSYIPPDPSSVSSSHTPDLSSINTLPEATHPGLSVSPGRLFLPQILESAKKHGGWPSWLGQWWANLGGKGSMVPGHRIWARDGSTPITSVGEGGDETRVQGNGTGLSHVQAAAGGGRVWVVKGRQWTEVRSSCLSLGRDVTDEKDMNRATATRLRVEFDGPDVSQEMLYTLFRVSLPS